MKFLSHIGLRWWKESKEKHQVTNHPHNRKYIRIKVRECRLSGVREYYFPDNYGKSQWKNCPFGKNEIINFEELKKHANSSIQH